MITSTITAVLPADVKTVWDIVTDVEHTEWRSDLDRTEVSADQRVFIEYDKNGIATHFTITKRDMHVLYEFHIENRNLSGSWSGLFQETADGGCKITFTEKVEVKKAVMRLFAPPYLKKMQKLYVSDLEKKLQER